MKIIDEYLEKLAARKAAGLYRQRRVIDSPQNARVTVDGGELVNFCSNDYLGLANHPALIAAAQAGAARWGVGSGASHLVSGHFAVHEVCEQRFAAWVGLPAALSFSTGYMANLAVITALAERGDTVFADKLNHASLNDAVQLSRAQFRRYAHNDLAALERLLAAGDTGRKLIVSDTVFSMDGDIAPLAGLLELAERYDALLYLDDAHGFGVLGQGRGALAEFGLDSRRIVYMATLGKAAGVAGAAVAADPVIIDWMVNQARPYIYTTAAPPLLAHTLLASLDLISGEAWRRERLAAHIALFRSMLAPFADRLLASTTPIQPVLMPDNASVLALSAALKEAGFWVAAIRPPTVPTPCLRVTLTAAHTAEEVAALAACLVKLLKEDLLKEEA